MFFFQTIMHHFITENQFLNSFYNSFTIYIKTSSFVQYLYNIQCSKKDTNGSVKYKNFCLLKFLSYVILLQLVIRSILVTFCENFFSIDDQTMVGNSQPVFQIYHYIHPFLSWMAPRFKLFTRTIICSAACSTLLALAVDYLICFKMDLYLLKVSVEMMVQNRQHFKVTWSSFKQGFGQFWYNFATNSKGTSAWKHFNLDAIAVKKLESFPDLSKRLRAQITVYSALFDATALGFNFLIGKFKQINY